MHLIETISIPKCMVDNYSISGVTANSRGSPQWVRLPLDALVQCVCWSSFWLIVHSASSFSEPRTRARSCISEYLLHFVLPFLNTRVAQPIHTLPRVKCIMNNYSVNGVMVTRVVTFGYFDTRSIDSLGARLPLDALHTRTPFILWVAVDRVPRDDPKAAFKISDVLD